jgi:hypothetical protein
MMGISYVGHQPRSRWRAANTQTPWCRSMPCRTRGTRACGTAAPRAALQLALLRGGHRQSRSAAPRQAGARHHVRQSSALPDELAIRGAPPPLRARYEDWLVEAMRRPGGDAFRKRNDIIKSRRIQTSHLPRGQLVTPWPATRQPATRSAGKRLGSVYLIFDRDPRHASQSTHGRVSFDGRRIPDTASGIATRQFLKGEDKGSCSAPFKSKVRSS